MLSSQNRLQSSTELNERCLPGSALSIYADHEIQKAVEILNGPEKAQINCRQEEEKIESSVEAKETKRQDTKEQTAIA